METFEPNHPSAIRRQAIVDAQLWWTHVIKYKYVNINNSNQSPIYEGSASQDWRAALRSAVERTILQRHEELIKLGVVGALDIPGSILLVETSLSMSDGLAANETRGMLDVHNCPRPDFWIGYISLENSNEILLSWIPEELKGIISKGVDVIPERCACWFDATNWTGSGLFSQLR